MRLHSLFLGIALSLPIATMAIEVDNLKCENLVNPLAIDSTTPHFSWISTSDRTGDTQTAYQILVASSEALLDTGLGDLWDTGKVKSPSSVMIGYNGKKLDSGNIAFWKVRVWDNKGKASEWSQPSTFGIGLLNTDDWKAHFIGRADGVENYNSPLFGKSFTIDGIEGRAMLHVNSLGYHEVYINGVSVNDAVLTPAVSQFNKRSQIVTYDVTDYLTSGKNDIIIWVGHGWYRQGLPGVVEGGPFVRAQLDIVSPEGNHTFLATDDTWKTAESGYKSFGTWRPHEFGGEKVDASKIVNIDRDTYTLAEWKPVAVKDIPIHAATPQMVELNRVVKEFNPVSVNRDDGDDTWIYDMGKDFTGRTRISFKGLQAGDTVRISYCDFLNEDGSFRDRLYEDYYIGSGLDGEEFVNRFNYKAYRYMKLSGVKEAPALSDVTAGIIHTDYSGTASFECSDPDMNDIYNMLSYTLQCLTLGGDMVDCPQIERLGYGGDGNASTPFVQTVFNMAPTYMNWMQAWADCMREDGSMPHTAPNPYMAGGGPYWCGFIITASWHTYLNYGDSRLLERYYPYMKQWLGYVKKYTVDGLLTPWPDTDYRWWYLGDWATPDGIDQTDPRSIELVANCYIAVCFDTMAKIAGVLGMTDEVAGYKMESDKIRLILQEKYYDEINHSYGTSTQIDIVYPMLAGVTPAPLVDDVRNTLMTETAGKYKGHLATGLMGLPIVTEWAIKNRESDFIYNMLKKRDYPGFLYMIENGATTTWEHWNGQRSRIHNCYNSIGLWFYQGLAGIKPDETTPGYKKIIIEPQPVEDITWVKASKETPHGPVAVEWNNTENSFILDIDIPVGSEAQVKMPYISKILTINGKKHNPVKPLKIPSGKYKIVSQR